MFGGAESDSLTNTCVKKFPNTSAFLKLVQAVTIFQSLSFVFKSAVCSWTLCLLLANFQKSFGFSLHWSNLLLLFSLKF